MVVQCALSLGVVLTLGMRLFFDYPDKLWAGWLVIGGLVTAYFLMGSDDTAETTETADAPKAAPIYHEVKAPFIVNFAKQSNDAVRYLQIKMKVMAGGCS